LAFPFSFFTGEILSKVYKLGLTVPFSIVLLENSHGLTAQQANCFIPNFPKIVFYSSFLIKNSTFVFNLGLLISTHCFNRVKMQIFYFLTKIMSKSQTFNFASQKTMKSYLQESGSTILITCSCDLVKYAQESFANILSYDLLN